MPANHERVPRKRPFHKDKSSRAPKWEYAQGPERERPARRESARRSEPDPKRAPERGRRRPQERKRVAGRQRAPERERRQERERVDERRRPQERGRERAPNRKRPQEPKRTPEARRGPVQAHSLRGRTPPRKAASGRVPAQNRRPPQSRKRAVRRRRGTRKGFPSFLLRVAALFVLFIALGNVGSRMAFQELQVYHPDQSADGGEADAPAQDKTPFATAASDIAAAAPDYASRRPSDSERKDGFYNILVAGADDHNGGSDTVILVSVDAKSHRIFGVSVPRDTKAVIGGKPYKINAAYKIGGMRRLAETVSEQMAIPIDYTVEVDLNGFAALIDAVGGVVFDVPLDMDYEDPKQNLSIHVSKGVQRLDGETALKVVRFRHNSDGTGYPDQDLGRIRTQQNFLKAAAKSMLSLSNLTKISDFVRIFQKCVKTELTAPNIAWLLREALSAGSDGIQFATLPGTWKSPYIYTDAESALELINAHLNPYKEDRTLADLQFPS